MGWAYGIRNGREVGYSVEAECDFPGCDADIDRGVSYMCGGPIFAEHGCEGFFCEKHLPAVREEPDETVGGRRYTFRMCQKCADAFDEMYPEEGEGS